ncbi:MAG: trypsin-like peptidase domain-containing protein [Deltaproteobacteria bacterium]|nr:trypsin-like peptidase domain-containing protein [Deltaproteobacteria bacterium]
MIRTTANPISDFRLYKCGILIMKELSRFVCAVLLFFSTVIIDGCTMTAYVTTDNITTKDTTFIVSNKNDPIGVAPIISEELSKLGFSIQTFHSNQKMQEHEPKLTLAFGSGFFISEDGMLISNLHVVKDSSAIIIKKVDGESFKSRVIIIDEENDIAILKPLEPIKVLKWMRLDQSENVKIGDHIKVVGFPLIDLLGKHPRVTEGIVSADVGLMDNPTRFQVSAAIQPGNSGGPILNEKFHVIGIATEKLSDLYTLKKTGTVPQNVNFGIKINYAAALFNDDIRKSIDTKTSDVVSLEDAIEATALIAVNDSDTPKSAATPRQNRRILLTYSYNYAWDGFYYTLLRFNMQWIDENSGEIIANGNFSGTSFSSYETIVRSVLKEIFAKAGIK